MGNFSADTNIAARKQKLRQEGLVRRHQQPDKEELSRRIFARLVALPEYENARTIMSYVSMADEVCTRPLLTWAWERRQQIVAPRCVGRELQLVVIQSMDELAPSKFGILEPRPEVYSQSDRIVDPTSLDLVVIPGLVFDRSGGRIGYGKGYYDRLLRQVRGDTAGIALAFECQIIDRVPMLDHDVRVKKILTEQASYDCVDKPPCLP